MEKEGMINRYTCDGCKKTIVTILVDDGVTPAFLSCKFDCNLAARMGSHWYRTEQKIHLLEPNQYEWYKPDSLKGLHPNEREHVKQGGLLLRKRFGVLDMFRGNCECGKWLMISPSVSRSEPLVCECGRRYYAKRLKDEIIYRELGGGILARVK